VSNVGELRAFLRDRGGAWAAALAPGRSLRMACNQLMADEATPLTEGCEVAFFPPVTGG
jgi:molybdopterin synthase sulfur carrier subunit